MKYSFFILILFLFQCELFAQGTASATISATIVNSVGAEKSGDIDFGNFSMEQMNGTIAITSEGIRTSSGGIKHKTNETALIPSIIIIGSDHVYDITMQSKPVIFLNNNNGIMRVDVFNNTTFNNNISNFPINAILTVSDFKNPGQYISSFSVTVNFN